MASSHCSPVMHRHVSPQIDVPLLVASFGASAVLVFGVPDGKLSQPRNFVGTCDDTDFAGLNPWFRQCPDDIAGASVCINVARCGFVGV